MANITKRTNKDGNISYRIRVYTGETINGVQKMASMTWTPPLGTRPTTAEKEAHKKAALFEEKIQSGVLSLDGKTKFADYAIRWMETAPLAPKTRSRYEELLKRIIPAIGHIKLESLQAHHLESFYKQLAEPGIKEKGRYAQSSQLDNIMRKRKLTRSALGELAGVSASTVSSAARGERVNVDKATQICSALKLDVKTVFKVTESTETLSPKTIHHHHQLISTILAKAKRERIIMFNVAAEHATAPKLPRTEAQYMDDEQAKLFLSLLLDEKDIRVKTALITALFTGVRRGELCGLSWQDIDFKNSTIQVKRASQYQKGRGVVEVPTKNESSIRCVDIPPFMVNLLKEYKSWWTERQLFLGKDWKGKDSRLFIQDDGAPLYPDTINFWLNRFIAKHNLPKITPHSLRHTFATLQITAGVDIRTLQSRTGHAQASTLINTYSHSIKSAQEKAAAALESLLLPDANSG